VKKPLTRLINLTLATVLWLIALPVYAAAQEAGQVLMAKGQLSVKGDDGKTRELVRRSSVFVGDVLTTGKDAQLQIRMKDGAMIELGANSEFIIKMYSYKKKGDAKDGAVLSLVKGGLRTVSGDIEKSTYKLETPTASMGIRGTSFDVIVCSPLTLLKLCKMDGTTYVILRKGTVYVVGEKGSSQILMIPGLATMIEKGNPPTFPDKLPQEVVKELGKFQLDAPQPEGVTGQQHSSEGGSDRDPLRTDVLQKAESNAIAQTVNQTDTIQDVTEDQSTSVPSTPIPSTSTPIPTRRPTITPSPTPSVEPDLRD